MQDWRHTWRTARLGEVLPDGVVRCHLSPRHCTIRDGQHGFCAVRANRGGRLVTMNYGKSVHLTEETIETEAVNHYAPGEPILSIGNIGCMLNCIYCQNWKTSQAKHAEDTDVYHYSPEGIVATALSHGIRVLSWTYNDPVVWHEFVLDTARLARKAGLINLYKSAFYISPEAVDELLPYIDIFSISIKSIDPAYYQKYTSGQLQPVLEATKQVFRAGKHVEVSTLMITDISDDIETARGVSEWTMTELSPAVPLHFVRFHPDYKLRNTVRTPIERLERARSLAIEVGLEHVYIGNVYDTPWSNTYCRACGITLVSRYGLNAKISALDPTGLCAECGRDAHFKLLPRHERSTAEQRVQPAHCGAVRSFTWHGDIRSLHVQVRNEGPGPTAIYIRRRLTNGTTSPWTERKIGSGESFRMSVAKSSPDELGPDIAMPSDMKSNLHEVFDRAHFPTVAVETTTADSDVSPLPKYPGRQVLAPANRG